MYYDTYALALLVVYLICGIFTVPTSPPDNVSAEVQSSTSILVTWEDIPLIDQNGVIITYEVLYEPMEMFNGNITEQTINTTNRSITLMSLEEFVNYSISVRGYTIVGPGNYSVPVLVMTLEDGKFKIIPITYSQKFSQDKNFRQAKLPLYCSNF